MTTNDDIFPPESAGFPRFQGIRRILDDEQAGFTGPKRPETASKRIETAERVVILFALKRRSALRARLTSHKLGRPLALPGPSDPVSEPGQRSHRWPTWHRLHARCGGLARTSVARTPGREARKPSPEGGAASERKQPRVARTPGREARKPSPEGGAALERKRDSCPEAAFAQPPGGVQ